MSHLVRNSFNCIVCENTFVHNNVNVRQLRGIVDDICKLVPNHSAIFSRYCKEQARFSVNKLCLNEIRLLNIL